MEKFYQISIFDCFGALFQVISKSEYISSHHLFFTAHEHFFPQQAITLRYTAAL